LDKLKNPKTFKGERTIYLALENSALGGEKEKMEKRKAILIFLAVFLCLSVSAVHAQGNEGYAKVDSARLNGQWDSVTVEPGETITAEIFFGYVAPASPRSEDKVEIVIAFDKPIGCLIEEIELAEHLDGHDYLRTFTITAPTEPGLYDITYGYSEGYTCQQAKMLFNLANAIGTVEVIEEDDEEKNEKWKPIYYKDYTIKFSNADEYGRYSIMFYQHRQHHNELRMEIDTWERHQIWEGSVSMSVEEDVWINYYTGKAWGIHLGETDFREIDPNPSNAVGESFFKLIMGFIPYAGLAMNLVDCGEALSEPKDEFDVYDEVDLTGHFKNPSKVFTTTNYLNDRDVVIIAYPCGPILAGKSVVRVDFPRLEFQKQGINDVVFCIDGQILGNVRHYIALPIEIGKQKIEV
jgi:hypothetical protein